MSRTAVVLSLSLLVGATAPVAAQRSSGERESVTQSLEFAYDSEPIASWGQAVLTRQDLMAFLRVNVPAADRLALLRSSERLETLLRNLLSVRAIAQDGLAKGLLEDDVLRAETYQAAMNFLSEKHLERVADAAELDDYTAQAEELYLRDPDRFRRPERFDFTHLLVRVSENEAEARARIAQFKAEIEAGRAFEELVVAESEDPSVTRNDGRFTDISVEDLDSDFGTALVSLEEGEISDPVKTQFGWHLIRLDARHAARVPPFEDVRSEAVSAARQQHRARVLDNYRASVLGEPLRVDSDALSDFYADLAEGGETGD